MTDICDINEANEMFKKNNKKQNWETKRVTNRKRSRSFPVNLCPGTLAFPVSVLCPGFFIIFLYYCFSLSPSPLVIRKYRKQVCSVVFAFLFCLLQWKFYPDGKKGKFAIRQPVKTKPSPNDAVTVWEVVFKNCITIFFLSLHTLRREGVNRMGVIRDESKSDRQWRLCAFLCESCQYQDRWVSLRYDSDQRSARFARGGLWCREMETSCDHFPLYEVSVSDG